MRLLEGQIIHRRYRLNERIAQGGMGEVWKASDIELGHVVAIKALRSDLISDNTRLLRLRSEAHNSANLAHPNIAALFEYYEKDGIGFLVMEYAPYPSLAKIYKDRGKMSPEELLPLLSQVAQGLYVAHSHGVIHRDIKPANILVSDQGQVKITDFGVSYSTHQAQITQEGMVVGTAQYISPEQAQGEQATARSDIYSLGIVAYEGLAGHRPFTGSTPVEIAAAQVNEPVPPLPADIPQELADYVYKMLEKDPQDRPANAQEVSESLYEIYQRFRSEDNETDPENEAGSENETESGNFGQKLSSQLFFWDKLGGNKLGGNKLSEKNSEATESVKRTVEKSHLGTRSTRSNPHPMKYHIHTGVFKEYPQYKKYSSRRQYEESIAVRNKGGIA